MERESRPKSDKEACEQNIDQQIKELMWLAAHDPSLSSALSLSRLNAYIKTRVDEYTAWNGHWCAGSLS